MGTISCWSFQGGDLENAIKHLGYRQKSITVDKTASLKWILP